MGRSVMVERLLTNINNIHELGRQQAFELGNPYRAKYPDDGEFYTKELPTGEKFQVAIEIVWDENDHPVQIIDTIIKSK